MIDARVLDERNASEGLSFLVGNESHVNTSEFVVVKRRRPGRWLFTAALAWLAVTVALAVITSDNIEWNVVGEYLFDSSILNGLIVTISLTLGLMALAIVLGIILATMRLGGNPAAKAISALYTWFMRGVPLLVQLIFWYNLALVFTTITVGIPGTGITLGSWDTNSVMTPFVAALLGLGLTEAAYVGEIIRGGLLGVDKGQAEAAHAIGMTDFQTFRKVTMPQVWRTVVPPIGNEFIGMFKLTSLASVIGVTELLGRAQTISTVNYRILELLIVASAWYLVCTSLFSVLQFLLEKRLGRPYNSGVIGERSAVAQLLRRKPVLKTSEGAP